MTLELMVAGSFDHNSMLVGRMMEAGMERCRLLSKNRRENVECALRKEDTGRKLQMGKNGRNRA